MLRPSVHMKACCVISRLPACDNGVMAGRWLSANVTEMLRVCCTLCRRYRRVSSYLYVERNARRYYISYFIRQT